VNGHAVVIAGGGATGLMLAGELALAGVDVAIMERRPDQDLVGQRALGFNARTAEVFDQRGIIDRFISQATVGQFGGFSWIPLDISDFPTRHNYTVGLAQQHIERILAGWVDELGGPVYHEREVTGFAQDDTGVDIQISDGQNFAGQNFDGQPMRAQYLVGCDGGRSLVRKAAGIDFPGWDATTSSLIAEVEMDEEPEQGLRRQNGLHSLSRPKEGGPVRIMVTEEDAGQTDEPTLHDLSEGLIRV